MLNPSTLPHVNVLSSASLSSEISRVVNNGPFTMSLIIRRPVTYVLLAKIDCSHDPSFMTRWRNSDQGINQSQHTLHLLFYFQKFHREIFWLLSPSRWRIILAMSEPFGSVIDFEVPTYIVMADWISSNCIFMSPPTQLTLKLTDVSKLYSEIPALPYFKLRAQSMRSIGSKWK